MLIASTLVGILVPVVTLVGYYLSKQAQNKEAARLKLDAAMRAGELFGNRREDRPSAAASASGLLALTQLGQADLAVALLVDLWSLPYGLLPATDQDSAGRAEGVSTSTVSAGVPVATEVVPTALLEHGAVVSTETAVLVINAALKATELPNAQLVAAELLCRNAPRLDPCQSLHWPGSIDGRWIPGLAPKAKLLVVDGLVRMTLTSTANENALRSIAVRLYGIWAGDPDLRVKGCIGTLICALLPALRRLKYKDFMQGHELVTLTELEIAARSASRNPDGYLEKLVLDRGEALTTWSLACETCDYSPGTLGTASSLIAD